MSMLANYRRKLARQRKLAREKVEGRVVKRVKLGGKKKDDPKDKKEDA